MKLIYFICLIVFTVNVNGQSNTTCSSPEAYTYLTKANKALNKKNYNKATDYLSQAETADNKTCGKTWTEMKGRISLVKAKIYNGEKDYDKALAVLNEMQGCNLGADCKARDSLKIVTLFLKFGKEKVKTAFKNAGNVVFSEYNDYNSTCSVFLPDLNYKFSFLVYAGTTSGDANNTPPKSKNFHELAKEQAFYELLK
ncbi:MAG: hypothetical protein WBP43_15625 [Chitinophagales bacterium]|nr:hypothetical protein [Bacteroidota bacterium]